MLVKRKHKILSSWEEINSNLMDTLSQFLKGSYSNSARVFMNGLSGQLECSMNIILIRTNITERNQIIHIRGALRG